MTANAWLNTLHFLSLVFVALCLGPALAHLLSLPNKISLGPDDYITVQQIYRGWALLGVLIVAALASMIALAWTARHSPAVFYWVLTALLCLLVAQAVFWIFTYPANLATNDWTEIPEKWQLMRLRWEYSHAVGAIMTVAALIALVASLLVRTRAPR